jgi:MscS family membrane protein
MFLAPRIIHYQTGGFKSLLVFTPLWALTLLCLATLPARVSLASLDGPKLTFEAQTNGTEQHGAATTSGKVAATKPDTAKSDSEEPATNPSANKLRVEGQSLTEGQRWAEGLKSPRATMLSFTAAMEDGQFDKAMACLDLSQLDHTIAEAKGKTYIFQLQDVLDRMVWINPATFALEVDLSRPYSLDKESSYLEGQDLQDAKDIVILQDDSGLWRFSAETLVALDNGLWLRWHPRQTIVSQDLDETSKQTKAKKAIPFSLWLPSLFPESWTGHHLLIPDYQWVCLLALIFIGFLADMVTRFLLGRVTRFWFRYRQVQQLQKQSENPWKPVGLLAQAMVWYFGTSAIGLPASVLSILLIGLKLFTVVSAVWTAYLFIDLLMNQLRIRAAASSTKFDDLLVPLVSRSLKALVLCMGVITGAKAFDLPITGLVGGLGLGGAALALAAKDAIANLFGSITVLTDRPFEVGDWIVTEQAEGTIETVGFRSTRIRTFYNSQITLPNSLLTTAVVDNMGRRRFRRIKTTLSTQYDTTPDQMDAFCEGIRELIRRHPYTRKDYYHVYFNQFGSNSLDILLYCFIECPDWSMELRERHRLFLDILRLAQTLKVRFAFPTRTLHLHNESPQSGVPDIGDSLTTGRKAAATVADSHLAANERPGAVEFHGPYEPE